MSRRVDKEEQAHLQYETEHTEPPKSRSVLVYMVILIAAAFLLLLLAYFMQQRTSSSLEGLHQSVNSLQSFDQLVEDNRVLHEEVGRLKEEKAALEDQLAQAQADLKEAETQAVASDAATALAQVEADALSALNQLRSLYNSGKYKDAIALLEANPNMEGTLKAVSEGLTEEERDIYDPLASYRRIAKLLGME